MNTHHTSTLVLGGTGKTGRRVVERLRSRGLPVRVGSRAGEPRFDWEDRSTWAPALEGVGSVYLTYYPDLAVPGAVDAVGEFAALAVRSGAPRIALLSGRGEPEAERAEQAVRATGAELTDPPLHLVHAELQRGLHARARAQRRDPAARR